MAFDTREKCGCCNLPCKKHPKYGVFCYKNHMLIKDSNKLESSEKEIVLRDGTFVYNFAVEQSYWKTLTGRNEQLKRLNLFVMMQGGEYLVTQRAIFVQAVNDLCNVLVEWSTLSGLCD